MMERRKCISNEYTSSCKQFRGKNSMKSSSVSNHVLITPGETHTHISIVLRGRGTIRRTVRVVDGVVVQRGQNRGQKRLLEQVGGEQLLLQYVPHRFGRFATTAVGGRGVLAIILKHTGARPTISTRRHGVRSDRRHVRLALYGRRSFDMAHGNRPAYGGGPRVTGVRARRERRTKKPPFGRQPR